MLCKQAEGVETKRNEGGVKRPNLDIVKTEPRFGERYHLARWAFAAECFKLMEEVLGVVRRL